MKVLAISLGLPKTVVLPDGSGVETGIFKSRALGRVPVHALGLEGDRQADLVNHGGENKAVYAYPHEHYAHWRRELGRDLPFGQLGENLTIEGLNESVRIGDVYMLGSARLMVTQPRKPCFKLGIRMDDPTFVKRFHRSGRTGFYLRVVKPGELGEGDRGELVERGNFGLTIRELWRLVFERRDGTEEARRALEIPWLAPEFRRPLLRRIARADR